MTLLFVFAIAQAVVGYLLSEADKRNLGRTPWGLPSALWALIWFLSLLLGLILYLVAHRSEVRRGPQTPLGSFDAHGQFVPPVVPPRSVGSDFPAYPRPADGGGPRPPRPPDTPGPPQAAPPPPPPSSSVEHSPPAWQPDPSGRFHYRWWTGAEWTSYVSTNGQVTVDTSPDQRIGPY